MNEMNSQFIVYISESGKTKIDVRLEGGTVWLSQKMMAALFQVTVPTINEHIKSIFDEKELDPSRTIRIFRIVQNEGKRQVERDVSFYNLDMILSVGYRIKSAIATRFRQWATEKLKEYIIKGFVLEYAENEYEKFHSQKIRDTDKLSSDFEKAIEEIPKAEIERKVL